MDYGFNDRRDKKKDKKKKRKLFPYRHGGAMRTSTPSGEKGC
jgi:hypothetical protein